MSREGSTKLTYAIKNLKKHWEQAKTQWNDQTAKQFESNHLYPLEVRVNAVVRGMEKLDEISSKVKRDCSETR
jgi:hypothetical protein